MKELGEIDDDRGRRRVPAHGVPGARRRSGENIVSRAIDEARSRATGVGPRLKAGRRWRSRRRSWARRSAKLAARRRRSDAERRRDRRAREAQEGAAAPRRPAGDQCVAGARPGADRHPEASIGVAVGRCWSARGGAGAALTTGPRSAHGLLAMMGIGGSGDPGLQAVPVPADATATRDSDGAPADPRQRRDGDCVCDHDGIRVRRVGIGVGVRHPARTARRRTQSRHRHTWPRTCRPARGSSTDEPEPGPADSNVVAVQEAPPPPPPPPPPAPKPAVRPIRPILSAAARAIEHASDASGRTSAEVRRTFLDYFASQRHEVVASSPLVPQNDPTLMFANAGMVQFKDVFVGKEHAPLHAARPRARSASASAASTTTSRTSASPRATTRSSRCSATSRFGDYFKEEAIAFAWELLTKRLRARRVAHDHHRLRRRRGRPGRRRGARALEEGHRLRRRAHRRPRA